jgi:hypothetical protein
VTGTSERTTSVSPVTLTGHLQIQRFSSESPLSPLSPVRKHGSCLIIENSRDNEPREYMEAVNRLQLMAAKSGSRDGDR